MNRSWSLPLAAIALACVSGLAAAKAPLQTLNIELQDSSDNPSLKVMHMALDHDSVKAGRVVLKAENQSKRLVHEVVVAVAPVGAVPIDAKTDLVIESKLKRLGEIDNLKPGAHGQMTLNLKPGKYLLFCNEPGHYQGGMHTILTVTR